MEEKMRIHIGGLGAAVTDDDLRRTFTSPLLGTVESVEVIRSKGRSFAYLDFIPASENGLSKLFSTYNGCTWKGGRLKLEKAKDHYLVRLRREWTEDSKLVKKLGSQNLILENNLHTLQRAKKDMDTDQMHIKIYFPKLRKIKPLPFKGAGKHKYSFQRVEIPPLPIHFCDCEEHTSSPISSVRNFNSNRGTETCGVNEEELNMVKSVLNKFLERENRSKAVYNKAGLIEEIYPDRGVDNLEVDDNQDQVSDEDGLVINMVSGPSNRGALFTNWGLETATTSRKDTLLRKPESFAGSRTQKFHGSQETKLVPDSKIKASLSTVDANVAVSSKRKAKGVPYGAVDGSQFAVNKQTTETATGSTKLSSGMTYAHKSAWKDLVNQKEIPMFHISDVLRDHKPEVEIKPGTNTLASAQPSREKDRQEDQSIEDKDRQEEQSIEDKESESFSDIQPIKLSEVENKKSARGSSWLQKSSWLQLVGDADNSSFNLAQILPGAIPRNSESQQFDGEFSSSTSRKKQKTSIEDNKHPVEDIKKPQEQDDTKISTAPVTPRIANVDSIIDEQNHSTLNGDKPDSDEKQMVKQYVSPPTPDRKLPMLVNRVPVSGIVVSDTCPFMRTSASMKEWTKMKTSLRRSKESGR